MREPFDVPSAVNEVFDPAVCPGQLPATQEVRWDVVALSRAPVTTPSQQITPSPETAAFIACGSTHLRHDRFPHLAALTADDPYGDQGIMGDGDPGPVLCHREH